MSTTLHSCNLNELDRIPFDPDCVGSGTSEKGASFVVSDNQLIRHDEDKLSREFLKSQSGINCIIFVNKASMFRSKKYKVTCKYRKVSEEYFNGLPKIDKNEHTLDQESLIYGKPTINGGRVISTKKLFDYLKKNQKSKNDNSSTGGGKYTSIIREYPDTNEFWEFNDTCHCVAGNKGGVCSHISRAYKYVYQNQTGDYSIFNNYRNSNIKSPAMIINKTITTGIPILNVEKLKKNMKRKKELHLSRMNNNVSSEPSDHKKRSFHHPFSKYLVGTLKLICKRNNLEMGGLKSDIVRRISHHISNKKILYISKKIFDDMKLKVSNLNELKLSQSNILVDKEENEPPKKRRKIQKTPENPKIIKKKKKVKKKKFIMKSNGKFDITPYKESKFGSGEYQCCYDECENGNLNIKIVKQCTECNGFFHFFNDTSVEKNCGFFQKLPSIVITKGYLSKCRICQFKH